MRFKNGVKVIGVRPELLAGLMVADSVYRIFGRELVVTSIGDGTHSKTSLHYAGAAADLRSRYFNSDELREVVDELRASLTDDFDVVVERTHLHLEYQPKA